MKMSSCNNLNNGKALRGYQLFFRTLANPCRLKIAKALQKNPLNVGEICAATHFEQSLVSHHLKMLEYHGMVFAEKRGKFRYYTLNKNTIGPLLKLIDAHTKEYCCKILTGEL